MKFVVMFLILVVAVASPLYSQESGSAKNESLLLKKKALELYQRGHEKCARILFKDIVSDYPDTEDAKFAKNWLLKHPVLSSKHRAAFIISSTIFAMEITGLYSFATLAYQEGNEELAKATPFLIVGAGLLDLGITYFLTKGVSISKSQASMFGFFNSWGFLNGWMIADILYDPVKGHHFLYGAAIGQTIFYAAAIALWKDLDLDEGAAAFSGTFSHHLALFLLQINLAVGGPDVFDEHEKLAILSLLVPMNAAAVGGYYLGKKLKWSQARVGYIGLAGIMGEIFGLGVIAFAETGNFESNMWILAGSQALGLMTGVLFTSSMNSESDSNSTALNNSLINFNFERGKLEAGVPHFNLMPSPFSRNGEVFYTLNLVGGKL